jgi:hypothetical protein
MAAQQFFRSRHIIRRHLGARFRTRERRFTLVEFSAVRARVDHEQQLAFLDDAAFFEIHAI